MKLIASLFVALLVVGSVAQAHNHTEETKATKTETAAENAVTTVTGKDKKVRKKKVEMCSECGKPESECECHGHGKKEEHKH